jgi:uncharacterized protein YwlG (UPF0340 family)
MIETKNTTKVKLVCHQSLLRLEESINEILKDLKGFEIIDIKFMCCEHWWSAMVIYI